MTACNNNGSYEPTKFIFGAATTFLAAVVTTVVLAVPILAAAVVLVLTVEVVDDVFDTTVGSDDGIGFPSLVCSFKT